MILCPLSATVVRPFTDKQHGASWPKWEERNAAISSSTLFNIDTNRKHFSFIEERMILNIWFFTSRCNVGATGSESCLASPANNDVDRSVSLARPLDSLAPAQPRCIVPNLMRPGASQWISQSGRSSHHKYDFVRVKQLEIVSEGYLNTVCLLYLCK